MKKKAVNLLLILVGCALWWCLSHTAEVSIKKWDAKLESALRHTLHKQGHSTEKLISALHRIQEDDLGEWVSYKLSLDISDVGQIEDIKRALKDAGATVEQVMQNGSPVLFVKRGSRIYQEISFSPPS